jgi:hypothetical protein
MDGIMSNINDEMKASADFAIKSAIDRFGQELDYSEEGIVKLNNILERIYWGFSNFPKDEAVDGLIFNTAIIWGSYLGEYMCKELGGTWISKGSDRLVSIENNQFSPISFVYQKITSHPEYSVKNYLIELNIKKHLSVFNPQLSHQPAEINSQSLQYRAEIKSQPSQQPAEINSQSLQYRTEIKSQPSQYRSEINSQRKKDVSIIQSIKTLATDKRLLFTLAGIGGILFITLACIIGYKIIKAGGISAIGSIASATNSNVNIPIEKTLVTATLISTNTPTVSPLPTWTPKPTITPSPSNTPSPTHTQTATLTPTKTQTPITPTRTRIPTASPTSIPFNPTNTPIPPTVLPSPTATVPAPVVIQSCEIDPSTVPIGINVTITFIVHFSAPGYGFVAEVNPVYPLQSGCNGSDDDGDRLAFCVGSSGELPEATTVYVTLRSSVGDCVVSYGSR